jgi:DNA-binding NarL/FixJ family response regulator
VFAKADGVGGRVGGALLIRPAEVCIAASNSHLVGASPAGDRTPADHRLFCLQDKLDFSPVLTRYGLELPERLHALKVKTQVIVLLGRVGRALMNDCIGRGAVALMSKPFNIEELMSEMDRVMGIFVSNQHVQNSH